MLNWLIHLIIIILTVNLYNIKSTQSHIMGLKRLKHRHSSSLIFNSISSQERDNATLEKIKNNNFKVTAIVSKTVTFTCSISLDDKEFMKSENYRIIWSKESEDGKDYEPLALDDTLLTQNDRIVPERVLINKADHDELQWSLTLTNLRLTDSSNYICQLNLRPYDAFWLKRFMLNVYEPASFSDSYETQTKHPNEKQSTYVKYVNEFDDLKLKCKAKGKPKPSITWILKYTNGTANQLKQDNSEIVIKDVRKNSKLDKVECQASNGYGPTASRTFKIDIRHGPYIITKSKTYKVPARTNEVRLNCSILSNPLSQVKWIFIPKSAQLNEEANHRSKNNASNNNDEENVIYIDVIASYSLRDHGSKSANMSHALMKLPLSKYQIVERHLKSNKINSILKIRMINEKDYGTYKCIATNEFGNRSIDFRLDELSHKSLSSDIMSLIINNENFDKSNEDKNDLDDPANLDYLVDLSVSSSGVCLRYDVVTMFYFFLLKQFLL